MEFLTWHYKDILLDYRFIWAITQPIQGVHLKFIISFTSEKSFNNLSGHSLQREQTEKEFPHDSQIMTQKRSDVLLTVLIYTSIHGCFSKIL